MRGQLFLACFLAMTALAAMALPGEPGITLEGGRWKQVTSLRSASEGVSRLQIMSRGAVRVRGERGINQVSLTVTKRVKAPSAMTAKALLDPVRVSLENQGSIVMVGVTGPEAGMPDILIELTVPRQIRQTSIQTRWGDVEATELDGAVFVESGGGTVRLDAIGQDAMVRTAGGEMRLGRIGGSMNGATGGGTIRVDTIGGNAEFSTGGGEIWVREARGGLRASTAGGSIHVERAGGEVVANSGGGVIEVAHAAGMVLATTSGGSIEVAGGRNVQCESGAGTIRLKGVDGSVRGVTANGMILAGWRPGATLGNSFLRTTRGDIIVYLPSNLAVTVKARAESENGPGEGMPSRIVSEFDEVRGRRNNQRGVTAEGRLNGGGPVLELVATGGMIHLRRLKP